MKIGHARAIRPRCAGVREVSFTEVPGVWNRIQKCGERDCGRNALLRVTASRNPHGYPARSCARFNPWLHGGCRRRVNPRLPTGVGDCTQAPETRLRPTEEPKR